MAGFLLIKNCDHLHTVEDIHEGTIVCTDCGLVDPIILQTPSISDFALHSPITECNKTVKENKVLEYITDHIILWLVNKNDSIIQKCVNQFYNIRNSIKPHTHFSLEDVMLYAICEIFVFEQIPIEYSNIYSRAGRNPKKYWDIRSHLGGCITFLHPEDLIERIVKELDLLSNKYADIFNMKEICKNIYKGKTSPLTTASYVIYTYFKENNLKITKRKVCDAAVCSYSSLDNAIKMYNISNIKQYVNRCMYYTE